MRDLEGRAFLITGATGGIGRETARALAARGARLILACRDPVKARALEATIAEETSNSSIEVANLDLSSLETVRAFAGTVPRGLDALINNAGVFSWPRRETVDGLELTMGVNYFAHVLLTRLLLPRLSEKARIVNISSKAAFYSRLNLRDLNIRHYYNGFKAYARSKLALIFFTQELARRLAGTGLTVNALHPGHIGTGIWPTSPWYLGLLNRGARFFQTSVKEGAKTSVYVAASAEVKGVTGRYFAPEGRIEVGRYCRNRSVQERLWRVTSEILGLETAG